MAENKINERVHKGLFSAEKIAGYIQQHAEETLTLAALADHFETTPSQLRRCFQATYGVTPKAFQDALRRERFKSSMKAGASITDAAYEAGFNSLSRIHGKTRHSLGLNPKSYQSGGTQESISYGFGQTSVGLLGMAATDKGVCFAEFGESEAAILEHLKTEFPNALFSHYAATNKPELERWIDALNQHLEKNTPLPHIPLDLRGTVLQIQVWEFLTQLPKGTRMSYQQLAQKINRPKAARAIGSACGKNRIALLVPCHRVLRGDGNLGGYRWGLDRKQALLNKEREHTRDANEQQ